MILAKTLFFCIPQVLFTMVPRNTAMITQVAVPRGRTLVDLKKTRLEPQISRSVIGQRERSQRARMSNVRITMYSGCWVGKRTGPKFFTVYSLLRSL